MHLVEGGGRGSPAFGEESRGCGGGPLGVPPATGHTLFQSKGGLRSMFVDCLFLEEKSKIGYIQGFR